MLRCACAAARVPVLGADTAVVVDGRACSASRAIARDALEMLARLSGRTHEVLSAVALAQRGGVRSALSRSEVRFRALQRAECEAYWDSGEPRDKAGAYAIQGLGAVFVEALHGSYSGVMGLPLFETAQLLTRRGVPLWHGVEDHETAPMHRQLEPVKVAALQMTSGPMSPRILRRPGALLARRAPPARAWRCCRRISPSWDCAMRTSAPSPSPMATVRCSTSSPQQARELGLWIVGGTTPIVTAPGERVAAACLVYDDDGRARGALRQDPPVRRRHSGSRRELPRVGQHRARLARGAGADAGRAARALGVLRHALSGAVSADVGGRGAVVHDAGGLYGADRPRALGGAAARARDREPELTWSRPAQWGRHASGRETYGDSLIVDYWGTVLARLRERHRDRDRGSSTWRRRQQTRRDFPALTHRVL